ncbi:MAG: peptidylprolyl isomerase [Verrucomicrobiota bacterium]|nr:peptidylprolyl isomerase [Verrucomicrobiota bacterium]
MIRPLFVSVAVAIAAASFSLPPRALAAAAEEARVVDGIAAVVNGDVITLSQVRGLVGPRERILRQQLRGPELEKQLEKVRSEALQDLIDRQLIINAFKEEKLSLPDYFVEQRLNDIIRENFGGDRNTFIKTLQAQNYSLSDFKKNELEKIIVAAMRGKNVKPNTVASPAKIEEYYRTHREEFSSKEEVKLRLIMVPSRGSDSSGGQKALAEEILSKVANGGDFARMAQIYSEDSTRDSGGDWGWVARKTLAPELEKVAFGLRKGKVSNIVSLGGNYYILKVEDRRGGETKGLAQVRGDIEKKLIQIEAQRLQENWLTSLRQKATIRRF